MRRIKHVVWTRKIVRKLRRKHGLTKTDVAHALANAYSESTSRSTGKPCRFGYTPSGRHVIVIFKWLSRDRVFLVSAFEVPEP